jgi:NADPH:quinone reductase-like Zn-dependent oxidoreductase
MATMQAVQLFAHGGPEVLELREIPRPEPGPGEVLVRVTAVSLNHLDLWVRRGMPGFQVEFPRIPGCDGTGVVAALGAGVSAPAVGTAVVLEPGYSSGTSAHDLAGDDHLSDDYGIRGEHCNGFDCEYVVLPARYALPLPAGLDPVAAAAAPLTFLTAWGLVVERARLRAGESALVLAAASGVGSAAIQIARDLGARVFTTGSSAAKRALGLELGAEAAFDTGAPGWEKELKRLTGGRGVDVVVEHVGPATWDASLRALARNGRLVTCGGTTGPKVSVLLPHLFIKNQSILGSTMGPRRALPVIFERLAAGRYRSVVDRVLPLSAVALAHAALEAREVNGKIVLQPGR